MNQPLAAEHYESAVTVLWGVERGKRLAVWRMGAFLTQAQLGKKLGVTQQVIHSIEAGRMLVCERFTLQDLKAIVGDSITFVLMGPLPEGFSEERVRRAFFQYQFKKMQHKKRIAKRTNAQKIEIDGWKRTDHGLARSAALGKPSSRRGNRTPGPRPKYVSKTPKKDENDA